MSISTKAVILTGYAQVNLSPDGDDPAATQSLRAAWWVMANEKDEIFIHNGIMMLRVPPSFTMSLDTLDPVQRVATALNNPWPSEVHEAHIVRRDDWFDDHHKWRIRHFIHPSFTPPWNGFVDSPLLWFALTDTERVALVNTRAGGAERQQYINLACATVLKYQLHQLQEERSNTSGDESHRLSERVIRVYASQMFNDYLSRSQWNPPILPLPLR